MTNTTYSNINLSIHAARLIEAGFRFVKVLPRGKKPIEVGWTKSQHYSGSEKTFTEWVDAGGNYGVRGDLHHIIIDTDNEILIPLLEQLPETFTVRSGSGRGLHAYYLCDNEGSIVLADPENSKNHYGEIQAVGKMVVGPGCIHPSGGTYEIVKDVPVATITLDDVKRVFGTYIKQRRQITPEEVRRHYQEHGNLFDSISLSDVGCFPTKPKTADATGEIQGGHPLHGSTTGFNFSINPRKNLFHCYRCNSGGGPLEWLAVAEGIIDCSDAGPGCLRGDTFKRVLEIAREKGIKIPELKRERFTRPKILDGEPSGDDEDDNDWGLEPKQDPKIVTLEELPDKRPDHQTVLLDAPPRLGKTHHVISKWVARDSATANVITTSHNICKHHIRVFKQNKNEYSTAVHLMGKDKACAVKDQSIHCQDCSHYPYEEDDDGQSFLEFRKFAREYLQSVKVLTKENTPKGTCPYYLSVAAEPFADFVFTVSQNMERLSDREHWVFDEDPTIGHFFAESASFYEATFHGYHVSATSIIEQKWAGIQKYKTYLLSGKRPKGKKTLLRIIEILEQLRALTPLENVSRGVKTSLLEELNRLDLTVPPPEDISPYKLIESVKRYEQFECLSPFVEALLFQYGKKKFIWTGDNPATLHIVADGERIIKPVPEGKITIIGNTRAEIFIRALVSSRPDYHVIRINKFPYADWFILCVLDDESGKKYGKKTMERLLKTYGEDVDSDVRCPTLVLTGSEKDQGHLHKTIGGITHCAKNEGQIGHLWNYIQGGVNIFYQNSVISRGIDVDIYTLLYIYSSDFANPYWQARMVAAKDENDVEEQNFVSGILNLIIMDETTNSILRISPTRKTNDGLPRVVCILKSDLWKVKEYVRSDIIKVSVNEDIMKRVKVMLSKLHGNAMQLEMGKDDDGYDSYLEDLGARNKRRNNCGKPDVQRVAREFEELGVKSFSDWKKSYNILDLDEIAERIRKYLSNVGAKGKRIREDALIRHIISKAPKNKGVYRVDVIARILHDMVASGEVIRDEGLGPRSMVSLRDGYVRSHPDIGRSEQFDV